jgi:hypothetical protein
MGKWGKHRMIGRWDGDAVMGARRWDVDARVPLKRLHKGLISDSWGELAREDELADVAVCGNAVGAIEFMVERPDGCREELGVRRPC